jgi:hypothetical protein
MESGIDRCEEFFIGLWSITVVGFFRCAQVVNIPQAISSYSPVAIEYGLPSVGRRRRSKLMLTIPKRYPPCPLACRAGRWRTKRRAVEEGQESIGRGVITSSSLSLETRAERGGHLLSTPLSSLLLFLRALDAYRYPPLCAPLAAVIINKESPHVLWDSGVQPFSVEHELQMSHTCNTDGWRISCTCNTDGFCTCSTDGEQRVASSRRVQCCAMQCMCARANKGLGRQITGRADTSCRQGERGHRASHAKKI